MGRSEHERAYRRIQPGKSGIDVMHFKPAQDFFQAPWRRGTGAGMIAAVAELVPYLPGPIATRKAASTRFSCPKTA